MRLREEVERVIGCRVVGSLERRLAEVADSTGEQLGELVAMAASRLQGVRTARLAVELLESRVRAAVTNSAATPVDPAARAAGLRRYLETIRQVDPDDVERIAALEAELADVDSRIGDTGGR